MPALPHSAADLSRNSSARDRSARRGTHPRHSARRRKSSSSCAPGRGISSTHRRPTLRPRSEKSSAVLGVHDAQQPITIPTNKRRKLRPRPGRTPNTTKPILTLGCFIFSTA
jgi:hypothetical protein